MDDLRVDLHDYNTESHAFADLSDLGDKLGLGFAIEANGDLDLVLSRPDARILRWADSN